MMTVVVVWLYIPAPFIMFQVVSASVQFNLQARSRTTRTLAHVCIYESEFMGGPDRWITERIKRNIWWQLCVQ